MKAGGHSSLVIGIWSLVILPWTAAPPPRELARTTWRSRPKFVRGEFGCSRSGRRMGPRRMPVRKRSGDRERRRLRLILGGFGCEGVLTAAGPGRFRTLPNVLPERRRPDSPTPAERSAGGPGPRPCAARAGASPLPPDWPPSEAFHAGFSRYKSCPSPPALLAGLRNSIPVTKCPLAASMISR